MSHKEKAISQAEMDLRQQGSRRVAGSTQKFLKHHAPFDKMKAEALQLFAEKAQLTFHAADSEIVGPDSGNVRFFYVIESGKVQARQAGEVTVTEYSVLNLGPGESFPIGAVTFGAADDEHLHGGRGHLLLPVADRGPHGTDGDQPGIQPVLHAIHRQPAAAVAARSCSSSLPSVPASNRRSIRR